MKKAQTLAIAFISILTIVIIFTQLFISEYDKLKSKLDAGGSEFQEEAGRISTLLSGRSSPYEWSHWTFLKKPGLAENGVIEEEIIKKYATIPYSRSKMLLGVKRDFVFFFTNATDRVPINLSTPSKNIYYEYFGMNLVDESMCPDNYCGGTDFEANFEAMQEYDHLATSEKLVKFHRTGQNITNLRLNVYVFG